MRRQIFDKVGGFSTNYKLNTAEDWDLWLRLIKIGCKTRYIIDYLGEYRIHENNSSIGNIQQHVAAKLHVLNKHISLLEKINILDKIKIRSQKSNFYYGQGRVLQKSCNIKESFTIFIRVFLCIR